MDEREVEISEALLLRLLHTFRRGLKPLTLDEIIALLKNG